MPRLRLSNHLGVMLVILFATAISAGAIEPVARSYPDSVQIRLITSVQQQIYRDRFDSARVVADSLIRLRPADPAGYLFKAIVLVTEMFDAEDDRYEANFKDLIDTVITLAGDRLAEGSPHERAWMYLYLGHAASYNALFESHFGSLISALKKARAGASDYKRGLKEDSTVYDLYFGLGLYHYWKSAKAGLLRWVGLIHNDRDRGIEQLRLAADSSVISRQAARSALIWIWLDRDQYDSALAITNEMLRRYPDGRAFLWPLARIESRRNEWARAASTYERLRDQIAVDPGNYYNLIECDYQIAQAYDKLNEEARCREIAQRATKYFDRIPGDIRREQRERLNYLERAAD